MYFGYFPYGFLNVSKNEKVLVKDIIRAVQLGGGFKEASDVFLPPYLIGDNETPELISLKFYDTTAYGWIVMALNDKFDRYDDFPVSDMILLDYCTQKYGDPYGIHHYVDSNTGRIVDAFSGGIPITNYEYESDENEKKRPCNILRPELVSTFVKQFQQLIADA